MAPPTAAKRPHAAMSKSNQPIAEQSQQWPETSFPNFDCSKYDYMPTDDGGFWKLQQNYAAESLPDVVPRSVTSKSPVQTVQDIEWTCLSARCPSKPFKRKADLDRHYKQAHTDSQAQPSPALSLKDITPATSISNPSPKISTKINTKGKITNANAKGAGSRNNSVAGAVTTKEKDGEFNCDYPACHRYDDGFSRKDRLRIHFVDVHKEDVNKKGGEITDEWLLTRIIEPSWWRCTKCLVRVNATSQWECPRDGTKCEDKRREFRENMDPEICENIKPE
ncbi:uncharacterized protein CTRU02_205262 [Colletotrichum truncatum]|uniref:Uncharacterized protein n=1 Tax=Colletotrichum truncatum TaxID=5467 RepID=A0ACC3Z3H3_COLTU|nr:uncharacterized protein CTRU02_04318 [Colletotrichum truncatum]KAF6795508.1 hypothetical protein CTRU02_04318 [Colletotrichum truncatum]